MSEEPPEVSMQMSEDAPAGKLNLDADKETKNAFKSSVAIGAGTGAAYGTGVGLFAASQGSALGVAAGFGGIAAASGVLGGTLWASSAYLGGVLHRVAWHNKNKPKKEIGAVGTLARGVISPVSVPVGFAWKGIKRLAGRG